MVTVVDIEDTLSSTMVEGESRVVKVTTAGEEVGGPSKELMVD